MFYFDCRGDLPSEMTGHAPAGVNTHGKLRTLAPSSDTLTPSGTRDTVTTSITIGDF
ncbi:hypothetical protein SBV1_2360001 [Verrucomicrobia bacterium]|nr:hypothetical protein SBV1_2360001 [Verrucomicrobiota bacterium]